jgi:GMP synthase (glutamine-hydrolysing)
VTSEAVPSTPVSDSDSPRLLLVALDPADPPGRLTAWLREAGADVVLAGVPAQAHLGASDGLVVVGRPGPAPGTGTGTGAGDQADAGAEHDNAGVAALLRAALEAQLPLLAIGAAGQLLAAAAGGRVEPGDEGPEYGAQLVAKRTSAAADPLLREAPITPDIVQWHRDAITALPPGATLLASSPSYEHQAFRVGRLAWGFQFHIEAGRASVERWASADAAAVEHYDVGRILQRVADVEADMAETWAPVAAAFVEIARDPASVDEPPTTTVTSAAPIMDPAQIRAALAAEAHASRGGPVPLSLPTLRPEEHR